MKIKFYKLSFKFTKSGCTIIPYFWTHEVEKQTKSRIYYAGGKYVCALSDPKQIYNVSHAFGKDNEVYTFEASPKECYSKIIDMSIDGLKEASDCVWKSDHRARFKTKYEQLEVAKKEFISKNFLT